MSDIKEKLDLIETCIKLGQFSKAKTLVDRMKLDQVPRSESLRASNLSRRCGKVKKSLKILNPLVRNPQTHPPASDKEIADYAFSLHRIGASFEAESLLAKVDTSKASSALFFKSIIAFSRWEYERALPWLNEYIQSHDITGYQRLIGRSNRVGIFIFKEDHEQALKEIESLEKHAQSENLNLLLNLSLEQKAQVFVAKKDFRKATKLLESAEKKSKDSGKLLQTWIWKWKSIIQAYDCPRNEGLELLNTAHHGAMRQGAWEVARDFDFYKLKIFKDEDSFLKLYFGTPFSHYIERLKKENSFHIPESFLFSLGNQADDQARVIDFSNKENWPLTEMQERLVKSLLLDLYRPPKWGDLFNALFPDEYFDPFSSINRLHQILFRLNQNLKEDNFGFRVVSDQSGCRIMASSFIHFKIQPDLEEQLYRDPQLSQLKTENKLEFTINDVCQIFGGTKRTQQRWVKKMLEEGKLLKIGNNRSTRYKISS